MTLSDITHECESVCGCVWWWQRAESPSEKGERRAPQGYAKPTAFSWPACALPRWTRASGRGMESASQEEARFLGPGGGGSTAILAFPSCHCGDPEKQGPVKVVHPLLAITPCPTTFGFIGIAFLSRVGFTALLPWSGTSHQPWEGLTPSLPPTPPFL